MRVTQQKKRRNFPHRTHSLLHFMEFQFWTRGKNNYVCHIHLGTNEINHKRFVALLFFAPDGWSVQFSYKMMKQIDKKIFQHLDYML